MEETSDARLAGGRRNPRGGCRQERQRQEDKLRQEHRLAADHARDGHILWKVGDNAAKMVYMP